jgi:hypothetical protein
MKGSCQGIGFSYAVKDENEFFALHEESARAQLSPPLWKLSSPPYFTQFSHLHDFR